MHPPFGRQLTHPGIDERIPGSTEAPRVKALIGERTLINFHMFHRPDQGMAGGIGLVPQDVGVELAPTQFGAKYFRTCAADA